MWKVLGIKYFTCAPHPMPKVETADGGDQEPSSLRAITSPVPIL